MKYELCKNVMRNTAKRDAFNELAKNTFNLSFENWYQEGYWSETNIPYTLFDGPKAVSNVSVNVMEVAYQGQTRTYIQLGTVMTDRAYRNQGLLRFIINEVMADWEKRCDGMFLFANKKVLDFYPKFGFEKEQQYQYSTMMEEAKGTARKLDMSSAKDRELLEQYYSKTNPFSKIQVINSYGLLMFYCASFMKDCVYYSEEQDAVIIAEQEGDTLKCYDVFCEEGKDLKNILSSVAAENTNRASLAFTPKEEKGYQVTLLDEDDDTLFLLKGKENVFANQRLMFPEISHT